MTTANVHSFETFGSVDGPGVRFIVFLQGCKMRCQYCHNPDTWKMGIGEEKTVDEIVKKALRYKSYWGDEGGVTCSGGEPLLQIDFLIEFFKELKSQGVHTTLDTAAGPFTREEPFISKFNELMKYTDLVMLDIKHIDNAKHKELTKVENTNILDCAKYLSEINKDVWIRHVLVPGLTDVDADLVKLNEFIETLTNVKRVEVLPFHNFCTFKWEELGLPFTLKDVDTPSEERQNNAKKILHVETYPDFSVK